MLNLKDINLGSLVECEKKNKVLSYMEFQETINYKKSQFLANIYHFKKDILIDIKTTLDNDYNKYRKCLPIYKIIYLLYNQLLDDLVLEVMNSSIEKDPLTLLILLGNYLIPFGFLSYTSSFHCTDSEKLFKNNNYEYDYSSYIEGSYVLSGYGCCRHVASFASDFLTQMGIPNDIITCITAKEEQIINNMIEHTFPNHAIIGCKINSKYYLVDIFNQVYPLEIKGEYIETNLQCKIVLDYTNTNLFQPTLHWDPNLEYATFCKEEVKEKDFKVAIALRQEETERFNKFKQEHFDLYQKLAYLVPLELERTMEKENQKVKRI